MNRERMEHLRRIAMNVDMEDLNMGNWESCLAAHSREDAWMQKEGIHDYDYELHGMMKFFDLDEDDAAEIFMPPDPKNVTRSRLVGLIEKKMYAVNLIDA